jgi:hypothetical protein
MSAKLLLPASDYTHHTAPASDDTHHNASASDDAQQNAPASDDAQHASIARNGTHLRVTRRGTSQQVSPSLIIHAESTDNADAFDSIHRLPSSRHTGKVKTLCVCMCACMCVCVCVVCCKHHRMRTSSRSSPRHTHLSSHHITPTFHHITSHPPLITSHHITPPFITSHHTTVAAHETTHRTVSPLSMRMLTTCAHLSAFVRRTQICVAHRRKCSGLRRPTRHSPARVL